ncbi:MAG: NAD(P)/FAD-dependent oxidoreductase, partial [Rhizomicrobium sp.]
MHVFVVGAGVVGLAIARQAALAGHEVTVAEATGAIGSGTSSRNSEVIHAGLYYPTTSLRARHCVRGRRLLYALCASHGIPHRKIGKLLIVTEAADIPKLEAVYTQAEINGVENLRMLEAAEAMRLEPALSCVAAFHSPETGIVDSHRYMLAMRGDLEDRGGHVALRTPVERITHSGSGFAIQFGGAEPGSVQADAVVNAAGHGAQRLALATEGYPRSRVPRHVMAKGNYFKYSGKDVFSRLIYPAPVPGGLGIHVTLDMGGAMRFGPDVEWIDKENYDVDPMRAASFYGYIRKYFPALPDGSLTPDYAGIRPKLTGQGEPAADFIIDTPAEHGVAGLVNLFGIESPGLTSSLSVAEA